MEEQLETTLAPPTEKLTFEEFLATLDEDTWAEWVDGGVTMLSPASDRHQNIADFLITILRLYVESHELGWVRSAPFLMRLPEVPSGREPDILFVRTERMSLVQPTYLDGPADLVIEIVSPESISRDRGDKFIEYEAAGVMEYWLLDPERRQAEFYRLGEDGRYHFALPDAAGVYRSEALTGFWLRPDWLWQETLPPVLKIVREFGIV
jgi:Uma2 family endonuclease